MAFTKSSIQSQLAEAVSVFSNQEASQLAEAKGLFSPQAPQQNLVKGTVLYSLPALNTYYVIPANNVGTTDEGTSLAVVASGIMGNSLKYGVSTYTVYQPGTQVLMTFTNSDPVPGTLEAPPAYTIIGTTTSEGLLESKAYPPVDVWYNDGLDYYASTYASALEARKSDALTDKSYGAPLNLFHGDEVKAGDFDNFTAVTASAANFGALKARIDTNGLTDSLRTYADQYQYEAPYMESGSRLDVGNSLIYNKTAYSVKEGFGAITGEPFTEDEEKGFKPTKDDQLGFFRETEYKGKLVGGRWHTNQLPPDTDIFTRAADKIPFGTHSEEQVADVVSSTRAAGEVSTVKSPFIPVPMEKEDEMAAEEPMPEDKDDAKPWDENESIDPKDYPNASPANFADEYDYNTAEYWRARMRSREDYWKIPTPDDLKETAGVDLKKCRKEIEKLEETQHDYELPEQIKIKDPVSGKELLYYAAESFIRQMPDGSISISDGYGSEIRMVKGRIIISAATDVEIRPGRDVVSMAARHNVTIGGDSVFMHASNGDLYVKSEKNLNIMAGNGKEGQLTLEARSKDRDKKHKGNGRGIIIKSDSDLGIASENIYMGLYDKEDKSDSGLARTKSGAFIIDACGSTLGLMGEHIYGNAKSNVTIMSSGGSGSAVSLSAGSALIAAQSVQMGCGSCVINSMSGSASVPTLGSNGMENKSINASGSATLTVKGSVKTSASVFCSNSVMASSMMATNGSFGGASKHYSHAGGLKKAPKVEVPKISGADIKRPGDKLKEDYDKAAKKSHLFTGSAYSKSTFAYPSSKDLRIADDYALWVARWQNMLKDGDTWSEPAVKDLDNKDTYVYPGVDNWTGNVYFADKGKEGKKLDGTYKINSKQKEE